MANAKKSSILNRMKLAGFQSSTKIEALREELALMLARDPSAKALVFSQFTSMLDLIYYRLQQVCLACQDLKHEDDYDAFGPSPHEKIYLQHSARIAGSHAFIHACKTLVLFTFWWLSALRVAEAPRRQGFAEQTS